MVLIFQRRNEKSFIFKIRLNFIINLWEKEDKKISMQKTIWFISKYASPPQYAKAPSRLFYLAKESINLEYNVLFITSDSNHFSNFPHTNKTYNDEYDEGVHIKWIKTKKYKKTASITRILSWFDFEWKLFSMNITNIIKPDVVIVSSLSIFSIIYGYYLKRKFKAFLVFEIRDIWPLTMTEEGGFSKWNPLVLLIGLIEKFGYKKADLIVGTMPRLDLHVRSVLGYERPFFCSPLGFDPNNYKSEIIEEKNPFQKFVPQNKVIVGYAGSMGITNALEPFIEAIKLASVHENIHFLLVGSGDLKEGFEEQLRGFENVTFLPRIAQNEVKLFLKVCDILYLSTQHSKVWDYGQSMNKVVEYMLASKPIIASYSGYPSMIDEANCGAFVNSNKPTELKNAILNFVDMDIEERLKKGANGREWIYNNRKYSLLAYEYMQAIMKFAKT